MSKATPTDARNEGWRDSQFGGGFADAAAFDTYLQSALDEAANWASAKVGAALYAATTSGYGLDLLKRAELCFTAARLWRRRASFFDSQANQGLEKSAADERRAYLKHADDAWQCAQDVLAEALRELGVDLDALSGLPQISIGHIETGPFPLHSAEAINA